MVNDLFEVAASDSHPVDDCGDRVPGRAASPIPWCLANPSPCLSQTPAPVTAPSGLQAAPCTRPRCPNPEQSAQGICRTWLLDTRVRMRLPCDSGWWKRRLKVGGERGRGLRCLCLRVSRAVDLPANPGRRIAGAGGTSRSPSCSWYSRLSPTRHRSALHRLTGPCGGLWDCESFGSVGLRRRPASGLQFPRSGAHPRGSWELWSRAGRARREAGGSGNYMSQFAARRARGPRV